MYVGFLLKMALVQETIYGLTGIVTREYGEFRREQLVQGLPVPSRVRISRLYQFISQAPEEPDPAYHDAATRLARRIFSDEDQVQFNRGDEIALEYLRKHNGYFIPADEKHKRLQYIAQMQLVVKALIGERDSCRDIEEDIGFLCEENPLWIGYRVIVWGELEPITTKDKPPVVHYFKNTVV